MSDDSNTLNKSLVEQAVRALVNYEAKKRTSTENSRAQLIEDQAKWVFAEIQLKKPIKDTVRKPVRVRIAHSIFSTEENHSICVFCKDNDKEWLEEIQESKTIPGFDKVLSLSDVLKYYKQFKNRKELLSQHTHFTCHASIASHLYNTLGSDFDKKNAKPVQLEFTSKDSFEAAIQKFTSSTYINFSGRSLAVKVGLTSSQITHMVENVEAAVNDIVRRLKNGWKDISAVNVRTQDSTSLPIFSKTDNELLAYCKEKVASTGAKRKASEALEENTTTATSRVKKVKNNK